MEEFDEKKALMLAGRLSIAASRLLNCQVHLISTHLNELEKARDEYDNYIFQYTTKTEKK